MEPVKNALRLPVDEEGVRMCEFEDFVDSVFEPFGGDALIVV